MAECSSDDCLSIPFPRKCAEYCIERVLSIARPEEKIKILGMEQSLAESIFKAYNSGRPVNSFNDLRSKLTSQQIASIRMIFDNISQSQLNHFLSRLM